MKMKTVKKEVTPDGKVEVDVLVDGKYQKRVSEGILFEQKSMLESNLAIFCRTTGVFDAIIALEEFVDSRDLRERFEDYKRFKNVDTNNVDEMMAALDELWEKLKK